MKMNYKLSLIAGVAAIMTVTTAQATWIVGPTAATLASQNTPGDNITAWFVVDLTAGLYTYDYQLVNTSSDTIDAFTVSFNTTGIGAYLAGNNTSMDPNTVTWTFAPVASGGTSGVFFFTSLVAPTWGNAGALDSVPPSPWSSLAPGGQQVTVPGVPDGGATVMLLGGALSAIGLLRKKLVA